MIHEKYKISFLIAAHNEEKIIGKALDNLLNLPYNKYEVIVGLDGCTDKTEEIVKRYCAQSKKFKYAKLNLRQGKPEVINHIVKMATGDILIIHDADWIFSVPSRESLIEFLSVFDDPKVGGIAESFPADLLENLKKVSFAYRINMCGNKLWLDFQKKEYTKKIKRKINKIATPVYFPINFFRKELYNKDKSLADDFERTYKILRKGYLIVLFRDIEMPRFILSYINLELRDLLRQKIRTSLARKQLKKNKMDLPKGYKKKFLIYLIRKMLTSKERIQIIFWMMIMGLAGIVANFKKIETRRNWELRVVRK